MNQPHSNDSNQDNQRKNVAQIDYNILSSMISHITDGLVDKVADRLAAERNAATGNPTNYKGNANAIKEPKPWVVRINKELLNAGSYLVSGENYTLRWACEYGLSNQLCEKNDMLDFGSHLTSLVQTAADEVQHIIYAGTIKSTREDKSHTEASLWVRFNIEHLFPYEHEAENFNEEEWYKSLVQYSVETFQTGIASATEYLEVTAPNRAQSQQKAQGGNNTEPHLTNDDRIKLIEMAAQLIPTCWDNADKLRSIGQTNSEKGVIDDPIWVLFSPDGTAVKLSATLIDGYESTSLGNLLMNRINALQPSTSTPQQEKRQANTASQPNPAVENYAVQIAQHLGDADSLGNIFRAVQADGLLNEEIRVAIKPSSGILSPCPPGVPNHQMMTFVEFFDQVGNSNASTNKQQPISQEPNNAPQPKEQPSTPVVEEEPALEANEVHTEAANASVAQTEQSSPQETAETSKELPAMEETSEGEEKPEMDVEDPTPAPAENTGNRTAQDIADEAKDAATREEVQALLEEAQAAGFADESITAGTSVGRLSAYLNSRIKRLSRGQ